MGLISKLQEDFLSLPFIVFSVLAVLFIVLLFRYLSGPRRNLPPGPYGIPFFGYAPFLGSFPHRAFYKLSKKYGNVFRLNMAGKTAIVLEDFHSIKEAFSKPAFLGTSFDHAFEMLPSGAGVIEKNGKEWQEQRRFCVKVFNEITFGKNNVSELVKEEINDFLHHLENLNGEPVDFFYDVTASLINVISSMVTLKIFDYKSTTTKMLTDYINEFATYFEGSDFILLPIIRKIKSWFMTDPKYEGVLKNSMKLDAWFKEIIEEHKGNLDKDHPRDFIDYYLIKRQEEEENPDTYFSEKTLVGNAVLFFLAGNVDTRSALYWAIIIMAAFPDIQRRVQAEIDSVLGRERLPVWADHTNLPLVEATLRETHRWKITAPIGCVRKTLEDTNVNGYFIPKGAIIFPNLWAVHNDKGYWKDPENFRPERHISEDGKSLIKHDPYIPFSYGRRQCPGEKFANMELFIYLVAILQRFNIRMPAGKQADLTEVLEINSHPKPQNICFIPRQ